MQGICRWKDGGAAGVGVQTVMHVMSLGGDRSAFAAKRAAGTNGVICHFTTYCSNEERYRLIHEDHGLHIFFIQGKYTQETEKNRILSNIRPGIGVV